MFLPGRFVWAPAFIHPSFSAYMPTTTEHYHISTCIVPAKRAFWFQRNRTRQPVSQPPLCTGILSNWAWTNIAFRAQSTFRARSIIGLH
ncbi:hypothetical protein LZ31DRAFT_145529 [Colletotrichum somersetense]|nr:hypothetical protein LZ31DRAFT_145529 [Colletotrichum somersetense]